MIKKIVLSSVLILLSTNVFAQKSVEQREQIMEKRIEGMEVLSNKLFEEVKLLKSMTLQEKELWFLNKRKEIESKHPKRPERNPLCDRIEGFELDKYDQEMAYERLVNSSRFQSSHPKEQEKLIKNLERFNNLSEEKKRKLLNKRKEKWEIKCN